MSYEIISRNLVDEPSRGSNYSQFYKTLYVVVKFDSIEEPVSFTFYDKSNEEVIQDIENYLL